MDFGAGGFAIAPIMIVIRIVDRAQSPAFAAMEHARTLPELRQRWGLAYSDMSKYDDSKALQVSEIYEKLFDDLQRLFSSGRASARDQTEEGVTLLHVSFTQSNCAKAYTFISINLNRSSCRCLHLFLILQIISSMRTARSSRC